MTRQLEPTLRLDGGPTPTQAATADRRHPATAGYAFLVAGSVGAFSIPAATVTSLGASLAAVLLAARLTGRRLIAAGGGVIVAVTAWLVRSGASGLPLWSVIVGLLAAGVCFIPLLTWRRRPDRFPLLGIFGAIQGIYIYVGTVAARPPLIYDGVYPLHVREAGLVATLAYVGALVGAGMVARRLPVVLPAIRRWTSHVVRDIEPRSAFLRAGVLVIVGIAISRFLPAGIAGHLGAIPSILGTARLAGVAIMVLLWCQRSLSRSQKAWTVVAVLADAVTATSGAFALYASAGCAIAALIVLALHRRHLALWLALMLIPSAVILNVAKTEARAATAAAPVSKITALRTLGRDAATTIEHPDPSALEISADRLDDAELLGYIAVHVPRDYPYWNKKSYIDLPFVLVPRAIAPFKPRNTLENQFGRRYGLLNPNDFTTAANTPIQVEAWANFGAPGLIGVAVLVGLLLGLAEGWFDPRRSDGFVLATLLAYQMTGGIESGMTAFALAGPTVIIFIPVVRWALGHLHSPRQPGWPPNRAKASRSTPIGTR